MPSRVLVKAMVFPVVMYGCESWTIKKAKHWRTDVFELWCWRRLLRVPWTARRLNQSILKEINPEYSTGRTDAEAPILWPPDAKSQVIGKDPDAEKDWGQEEKETTEDEMVWWHHQLNGHGFGWTRWVSDGQGGRVCCSPRGHKELDTTERLNTSPHSTKACIELLLPRACSPTCSRMLPHLLECCLPWQESLPVYPSM